MGGVDAPPIVLSSAVRADHAFLLALRNHPKTRRFSFQDQEIEPERHAAWMAEILANPTRRLYVATERGIAVGSGRLDLFPLSGEAEVSLTVHWDHQDRGIGTAMIEALAREAVALGIKALVAHIKEAHTGSRIAFGRAAFVIEQINDGVVTMLRRL